MTIQRMVVVLAVVALGAMGAPAAAQEQPHFSDPCGLEGLTGSPTHGGTPPWTDICGGQFETLDAPESGLKVTATFAGEIHDDRLGYYLADWRAGDCDYRVSHDRGLGRYEAGGVFVADPGGDTLRIICDPAVEEPCPPVTIGNVTCYHYPHTRHIALTDAVTVDGNTVSWSLPFSGALAPLAEELRSGTTLTKPRLYAASKVGVIITGPGICTGTMCTNVGSDYAFGSTYTIGE